jgi:hypothetical protein
MPGEAAVVRVQLDNGLRKQPDRILAKAALPIDQAALGGRLTAVELGHGAGPCGLPFRGLSVLFGNRSGRAHVRSRRGC